jgi:prenylcysteine oxidase/farnesylcysteine lyase
VDITIFEKSGYVGGRSTTVNVFDDERFDVELGMSLDRRLTVGASIFVDVNKILVQAVEDFGLNLSSSRDKGEEDVDFAMYGWIGVVNVDGMGRNSYGRNLDLIIGMSSK